MPWKPGLARFAADLYVDGKPYPFCARVNLKRVLGELHAAGIAAPFVVLGDHAPQIEPLLPLAARRGFSGRIEPVTDGTCRARFEPSHVATTPVPKSVPGERRG